MVVERLSISGTRNAGWRTQPCRIRNCCYHHGDRALTVTSFTVQLLLWGVLAVALAVVMQGMVPREAKDLTPSKEAEVSEPIPSGGVGMVAYQGSLWNARCQISDVAIAAGETVNVVGRHGNTLIVLPATFPDSHIYDQTV